MEQRSQRVWQASLLMPVRGVDSVGIASVEVGRNEVAAEPEGTDAAVACIDFELERVADIDGKGFESVGRMEIAAVADMGCAPWSAAATFAISVAPAVAFFAVPIFVVVLGRAAVAQDAAAASAARAVAVPVASAAPSVVVLGAVALCVAAPGAAVRVVVAPDVAVQGAVALDAAARDVVVPNAAARVAVVPGVAVRVASVAPTFAAPVFVVLSAAALPGAAVGVASVVARVVAAPTFAAEDAPVAVGTAVAGTAADIAVAAAASVAGIAAIAAAFAEVTVVETAAAGAADSWRTLKDWP
jgi:hypothetical protein